jgi:cell division protein FtsB
VADTARKGLARGVTEELPKLAKRVGELEQRIEQLEQQVRETLQDTAP